MARIERLIVGIFGRINAGKSTLMNLLTQQPTSIVDSTPGTTTDIKSAVMELHALGPVQPLDTAGLDEGLELGEKKRAKTLAALEQVDVALLVIDPVQALRSAQLQVEDEVATLCRRFAKRLLVVFNTHADCEQQLASLGATLAEAIDYCKSVVTDAARTPHVALNLSEPNNLRALVDFVAAVSPSVQKTELLPFVQRRGAVLLHIPLDQESPGGRLLRPQEMAMEYLLRLTIPIGLYRVDLKLARSDAAALQDHERRRFLRFFESLQASEGVQLVLTDSQAIDVMSRWVPAETALTTFSVMMANQSSGGQLPLFQQGVRQLASLRDGDRVLVVEACNHDRMAEDIGTVQIPAKLQRLAPGVVIDHTFGREFPPVDELRAYKLAIHCGGCMIARQNLQARVQRLAEAGVPLTNYGLVLSWFEGPATLERVLAPWLQAPARHSTAVERQARS